MLLIDITKGWDHLKLILLLLASRWSCFNSGIVEINEWSDSNGTCLRKKKGVTVSVSLESAKEWQFKRTVGAI